MRILIEPENVDGGQMVVKTGEVCRVGRSAPAEIVLCNDTFLSGLHFSIQYGGKGWQVRDLKSRNGTFLNGARITEATLKNGDRIYAGQTYFRIRIEDEPQSSFSLPPLEESQLKKPQQDALDALAKISEPLFALLDAARNDRILDLLRRSGEKYQSLYEGQQGRELDNWAPYLVALSFDSLLLRWLLHEGWGQSWGVYLVCNRPFSEVRRHFRHFLLVEAENGEQLYFRFYDPRVLRRFLAGCTDEEADLFFGPVDCYLLEAEQPSTVLRIDRSTRSQLFHSDVLSGA